MMEISEGEDHIRNWMRNRNTLEFLGAWELMHNPAFKGVEFDTFLHEMAQSQLSRLNAIEAEKGFRKIDGRKSIE